MVIIINLYPKESTSFETNGIKTLQPISCEIHEEINGDYSLIIVMPKGDSSIHPEMIIKAPTPKGNQLFRVYMPDVDAFGNNTYYARHIFYDLLDVFIEDKRPEGNGTVAVTSILDGTSFIGTSDITRSAIAVYQMISPVNALIGAENSFIKRWGGEIERDNYTVRMLQRVGADRNVTIRYKKNLTGLTVKTDLTNVVTRIYPTGRQADGQSLLKLPEKYIESPLIGNYVSPKTQRFDYAEIQIVAETSPEHPILIPEEEALEMLRDAARKEFSENNVDKPEISADVEFIPLSKTEEYKDLAVLEQVYIGDTVHIVHEPLGLDFELRVVSYEYDGVLQRYSNVTLGAVIPSVGTKDSTIGQLIGDVQNGVRQAFIRVDGVEIELAGKVSFTNLEEPGQTIVNGSNITTGIIQGPDGRFYLNLETGDSAVQRLVDADGNTMLVFDEGGNYVTCMTSFNTYGFLYASGAQIGGTGGGLIVYGTTTANGNINSTGSITATGNISAGNLFQRTRQVVADVTLTNVGGVYSLNKTFATISYWSPSVVG